MAILDTIKSKVGVLGTIQPEKIPDTIAASSTAQTAVFIFEILIYVAIVATLFVYFYRKYKLYTIEIDIWAVGADGSKMTGKDRAYIRNHKNDMRLWKKKVTLPVPDRRHWIPTEEGKWRIIVYKFGAKDFTYLDPKLDESGVQLVATDSHSRKWAAIEWRETMIRNSTIKWYQQPIVHMIIMGLIFLAVVYLLLGKMGTIAGAFQSAGNQCSEMVKECSIAYKAGSGAIIQK